MHQNLLNSQQTRSASKVFEVAPRGECRAMGRAPRTMTLGRGCYSEPSGFPIAPLGLDRF